MRKNLRSILAAAGHEVIAEAANGAEACSSYKRLKPELVTMDVTMPVMSGIEAVRNILAEDKLARIIVISAFDQRSMLFEAMELGAKQYIIKPITAEKLNAVVDKVLGLSLAHEEQSPEGSAHSTASLDPGNPPAVSEETLPAIENRNGIFIIHFHANMSLFQLETIRAALQGLLFIKPLKLIFDFGPTNLLSGPSESALSEMTSESMKAGGLLTFHCENRKWGEQMQSRYPGVQVVIL